MIVGKYLVSDCLKINRLSKIVDLLSLQWLMKKQLDVLLTMTVINFMIEDLESIKLKRRLR